MGGGGDHPEGDPRLLGLPLVDAGAGYLQIDHPAHGGPQRAGETAVLSAQDLPQNFTLLVGVGA